MIVILFMESTRPHSKNVELGDFLVEGFGRGDCVLFPVKGVYFRGVSVRDGKRLIKRSYEKAVILKMDGSYLVGREVVRRD